MSTKKGSTAIQALYDPQRAIISQFASDKTKKTYGDVMSVVDPAGQYAASPKTFKQTTMGRWFASPSNKMPNMKTDNSAAQIADAAAESAARAAKEKERLRLKAVAGRRSLIATSGRGILEDATNNKKKLTGE